jgi:1,4-dihydroxy-2-naphthoyl-CoA hydrolase
MLRPNVTLAQFHAKQQGTLPEQYGFRLTELAEGRAVAEFEVKRWMHAPNGFLHAASVICLADTVCGYACVAHLPEGARGFTTLELKSNFLSTAKEGVIRAIATADHLGRTTQVWSATVLSPEGKTMALFRCTQMVLV